MHSGSKPEWAVSVVATTLVVLFWEAGLDDGDITDFGWFVISCLGLLFLVSMFLQRYDVRRKANQGAFRDRYEIERKRVEDK